MIYYVNGVAIADFVTPQMYGAAADGTTDDTAAFQAALNSGYNVYVPLSKGEVYKITDTLTVPSTCKQIYSDGIYSHTLAGGTVLFDLSGRTDLTAETLLTTALFYINMQCLHITGIKFTSVNVNGDKVGLFADLSSTLADKDFRLESCAVTSFYKVFDFRGRGCEVYNSSLATIEYIGTFNWADANETNANHPASTGQRGICFKNNRLHSIRSGCLSIASGHAYGLTFQNNTMDDGRGFIVDAADEAWNWMIEGNVLQGLTKVTGHAFPIDFKKGGDHCIIANNILSSRSDYWSTGTTTPPDGFFKCGTTDVDGVFKNSVFANNTMERTNTYCCAFYGGISNSSLANNVFYDIGAGTNSARSAFYFSRGTFDTVSVTGNTVVPVTNANVTLLRTGGMTVPNSKIVGNAGPAFLTADAVIRTSTNFVTDELPPA